MAQNATACTPCEETRARAIDHAGEWLEADGLGGFASGTVGGVRTRRYHALLLAATAPPGGRVVLVNGFDAWLETPGGTFALTSQRYTPDVTHPDGARRITAFEADPWPRWSLRLPDGTALTVEIVVPHGQSAVCVQWGLAPARGDAGDGPEKATLNVRPFLSGRDYHALHHENPAFRFDAEVAGARVTWRPYASWPAIHAWSNGGYRHDPIWYRNFLYEAERTRGLDYTEDLASPGVLRWELTQGDAVWILAAGDSILELPDGAEAAAPDAAAQVASVETLAARWREGERRRRLAFASRLTRAADAYIVRRGSGRTIIAGYPWFTDWGRDTFIALRGLCLATGRLDDARAILIEWASTVSRGMLPNRFTDGGEAPEFNAVDASLWYVVAVYELERALAAAGRSLASADEALFRRAIEAILDGYARGTRHGIRADDDGLLAAGTPGVQLTWMDAKIGDWVVTPRIGKPVEVEALWVTALRIGAELSVRWRPLAARAEAAFRARFWNAAGGYLYDVIDVDHRRGADDPSFRPNQIFAVGGLPWSFVDEARARRVVDAVEERLVTPLGLRSRAADEAGYAGRYDGDARRRDSVYHQGTVWPWLMGPFVEAWVRVRGGTAEAKATARKRFLEPLLSQLDAAGVGHLPEIADGDAPHTPRGCPFQAWSVGEALRVAALVAPD